MKKYLLIALLIFQSISSFCQILLEDKQGERIANNSPFYVNNSGVGNQGINTSLIKLNTGDQSLGFNYVVSSKNYDPANYKIHEFGVKAKSTEGFASIFNNGQFSPGIRFNYSLTKVPILSDKSNYVDWGGIFISYDINRYSLYSRDATFNEQFYSKDFKGLSFSFNYNALIKSKWILNTRIGYSRRNNIDDLRNIEVEDINSTVDPATSIVRNIIRKRSAREGTLIEFDSFPMIFALTRATPTDSPPDDTSKLRFGYTIYLKNLVSKDKPDTSTGVIFFLTRQDKSGVRAPVFGLDIQATDPFDVENANNGLQNRISVGFTTIFSF